MNPKKIKEAALLLEEQEKERLVLGAVDSSWKIVSYFSERYNYVSYFVGIRHSWTGDNKVAETQIFLKQEGEEVEVSSRAVGEVEFKDAPASLQESLKKNAEDRFSSLSRYHQYRLLLAWREPLEAMEGYLPVLMQRHLCALEKKEKKKSALSLCIDSLEKLLRLVKGVKGKNEKKRRKA